MGKSKKKKQQNSDFQKVKFKVGKKKPVGTNVTNTSFKSASINIHAQLEEKVEPTNRKNLTLKDLLMHLNHYNANIRQDSLAGLKDLFVKHPDIISKDLNIWLSKVIEKLVDTDVLVRQALCQCLTFALNQLKESDVKPFAKIFIAHICCGMTHINESIQLDSLSILEIFIDQFPSLLYPHIEKILQNFLNLISKKSSSSMKKKASKGKVISNLVSRDFNEGGKLTNLKNQCKVFGKLFKMLNLLKSFQQGHKQEKPKTMHYSFNIMTEEKLVVPLRRIRCVTNYDINVMDLLEEKKNGENEFLNEYFNEFSETLFHALINSWVELDPSIFEQGIVDSKNLQSVQPGFIIIIQLFDILFYLLDNVNSSQKKDMHDYSWFNDFTTHFLKYFVSPIQLSTTRHHHKGILQNKTSKAQHLSLTYNFLAAKSIIILMKTKRLNEGKHPAEKFVSIYYKKLIEFLTLSLEVNALLDVELINDLSNILFKFFDMMALFKASHVSDKFHHDITPILDSLLEIFETASLASAWKIPLVQFFIKLVKDNYSQKLINDKFHSKIESFSSNIISNIWSMPSTSRLVIDESLKYIKLVLVRNLLTKKQKILLESSIMKMTELQNGFSFCELPIPTQRFLLDIIFYLDSCSEQLVKNICKICQHGDVTMEVKTCGVSVLAECLSKEDMIKPETFVSFVLSLVIGYTVKELQDMNASYENVISWSMLNIFEDSDKEIPVQFALDHLRLLDGTSNNMWDILLPSIGKLLVMFRKLPLTTSFGLINMLDRVSKWQTKTGDQNEKVDSEINQIVDLILASLLYCVSSTYKRLINKELKSNTPVDNLTSLCVNILHTKSSILNQLIRKSINTLEEYKMNKDCVKSMIEVLLSLLHDEKLRLKMTSFKTDLQQVATLFSEPSTSPDLKTLLQQLELALSLL